MLKLNISRTEKKECLPLLVKTAIDIKYIEKMRSNCAISIYEIGAFRLS